MSASAFQSFLGSGIVTPFRRDGKRDFANDSGLADVQACVMNVLGTTCSTEDGSIRGELPWRPEFGSLLYRLKHRKGPHLQELAHIYIVNALARWEPRVIVMASLTTFDREAMMMNIRLRYNVIAHNVAGNNVVLRDVEQALDLPMAA